jgi:integrase/recombinase XerD
MSDLRQLPLMEPQRPEDLSLHSELRHAIPIFQAYLLGAGKSSHTVNAFTADLHLLADQAGGEMALGDFTIDTLNDFLDWLEHGRGVPCSRKSYARRVTTLKVFFKWLHELNAIPIDPAKPVLQRSGPAPLQDVLTPDEVQSCLHAARQMKRGDQPDTRPEFLLRLLVDTGLKKGEASALTPADIDRSDPAHPVLTVRHKVRNVFKERRIALEPQVVRLMDDYLRQYLPEKAVFNCTSRNLEYILTDIGEAAGVATKLSFEMLRWTCAVRDTRAGHEEDFVREKLGLSPISWVETRAKIRQLIDLQMRAESR